MAVIDLKNVTVKLRDGFDNDVYSPTVASTEAEDATVIEITTGTMGASVPVGAHCTFAGDTTKYRVTARTLDATGADEVQSLSANTGTGTFTLTVVFPPGNSGKTVTTGNIAIDAASSAVQTAIDAAMAGEAVNGVDYTAGDITVAGGPADTSPTTFTYDGTSCAKLNWGTMTLDDTGITGTAGTISVTTPGEAAGATESITITPALVVALSGGEAITFSGIELSAELGEGNLTYDETREVEILLDRGILDEARLGDEQPMAVSFTFTWKFIRAISGASTPSIEQALKNTGPASTWTTADSNTCAPYAVDIVLENVPPCSGVGELDEEIVFPAFYYTSLSHDADAGQVSVDGICNAKEATVTREDLSGSTP
jgi:hypothetical protein